MEEINCSHKDNKSIIRLMPILKTREIHSDSSVKIKIECFRVHFGEIEVLL